MEGVGEGDLRERRRFVSPHRQWLIGSLSRLVPREGGGREGRTEVVDGWVGAKSHREPQQACTCENLSVWSKRLELVLWCME